MFSNLVCISQSFEDMGYRGELMRWNYIPIDSIWSFHSGNETDLTQLPNDSGNWQKVNTEFLEDENGKPVNWQNMGWFKKKFDVPQAWIGKPIALRMGQFGASEIYLDGKLIILYGVVANNIHDEKIFVPRKPIIIQLDSQASHTVQVHYSNYHAETPGYGTKFIGFRLLMAPPDIIPQISPLVVPSLPITIGILIMFALFFLFVYFFDLKRLASLLTALALLNMCLMFLSTYFQITSNDWDHIISASNLVILLSSWLNCWQVLIIYALYYKSKMPRRTWFVVVAMLYYFTPAFISRSAMILFIPINLLVLLELFRMIISGVLRKKTGFWIILTGAIIHQTGFFVFVVDIFNLFPVMTSAQELLLMIFPQMGIPLTYALHLAWEFGTANRELRLQLLQVRQLSETTIRQEQEKQEILTRQKEKLETMVTDRTKELYQQKEELQSTLSNLKAAQAQLIQSEKMASLGELTAGIAHEIQNPLNFVNNFSDVNKELLAEMKDEIDKGNMAEAKTIACDIIENEEKINHHGKRADSIVKGMLQHSRSNTGPKEPTTINALADEYFRLSYHGLRAKDKSFNATLKADYDETINKINIIPQDIGRVLLNLYNNAFYAVNERMKSAESASANPDKADKYEPTVSVSTKKMGNTVEIRVKDNGNGIPQNIVDKIFQPFFSTKPTGQGTGLGLSLSYDIIKAHQGVIRVESRQEMDGDYTEFIIELPC